MAFSPQKGDAQISLSVFGSLVTEMSPVDLPEGVSPDNQDVVFAPGSVASRPGLKRVFAAPFPAGGPNNLVPTLTYAKSYVTPTGRIDNLYLDSNGTIWREDFTSNRGLYNALASVTPGTYAKSITAFGREYIAVSDGLHGQEVALQWDGTNLDRVTQDGPGAPPAVASLALPSVAMVASGAVGPLAITSIETRDDFTDDAGNVYFTTIWITVAAGAAAITPGTPITVAGSAYAGFNFTWTAAYAVGDTVIVCNAYFSGYNNAGGGTATPTGGITMSRAGNIVTVTTAAAHQLQVGYQAQISNVPSSAVGGGISSIVINNEDSPGIAMVTTAAAHGLLPGIYVSIGGVSGVVVGTGITSIVRAGNIVTVTTSAAHNLTPGALITIAGVATASFNTTAVVLAVVSTTVFMFSQSDADVSVGAGGTVTLQWPLANTATPTYFEVLSAPTPTTFQVSINYSDGTWTTGTVSYAWNGKFFVTAVPTSTSLQYQQYGPNASTASVGTVTPYGQAAPGTHQLQVMFLTRNGYITRPSPPVKFVANGGQYLNVTDIPLGPPNVVARILAFTGAEGSYFFYLPTPGQVNGQQISTSTQINDNTTTNAILDFSDPTLFSATGISIPGNDLASQIILDGALGFAFYGSRIITWGQRNRVQNLLNMGFEGGILPSVLGLPTGWSFADIQGTVADGHFGQWWEVTVTTGGAEWGKLSQPAYQDCYGAPILQGNTKYRLRVWLKPDTADAALNFTARFSSATSGFTADVTLNGSEMNTDGSYLEVDFAATPAAIPNDLQFTVFATNTSGADILLRVDDLSIIYAENPYLDLILYGSYVNNPEAFDGLTGKCGPSQDTRKVMDMGIIRQTLCIITQDPGGRLHETTDNGVTEPAGWNFNEVDANCGLLSAFCLTKSQADDNTGSGGESWLAWASSAGIRIFGGDQPWKISQEIQPNWTGGRGYQGVDFRYAKTTWALNDPSERRIYFGVSSLDRSLSTAPNLVVVLDYRELDTASQIAQSAPIHTAFSGRLVATDHSRKWTRWNVYMNGASLMYRDNNQELSVVFLGGNIYAPGAHVGTGNAYTLDAAKLTDDDYGQIFPYWLSHFLVTGDQELQFQLNGARKLLAYLSWFAAGTGVMTVSPYCNSLQNPWGYSAIRSLSLTPRYDMEWPGANTQAQRIALKFASTPNPGATDNGFDLQKVTAWMRPLRHLPVRGSV